jgi:hypothetical protein
LAIEPSVSAHEVSYERMNSANGVRGAFTWGMFTMLAAGSAAAEPKCPQGLRPSLHGCIASAPAARTVAPTQARRALPAQPELRRQPEQRLEKVDRRILLAELSRLEQLLKTTPVNSADRPLIVRRLAEGYAELERQSLREGEAAKLRARRAQPERAAHPHPTRKF